MRSIFVTVRDGVRNVHWFRIWGYAVLVFVLSLAAAEGLAYWLTGQPSVFGFALAAAFAVLATARTLAKAFAARPATLE